jgi:hypothetical protein
VRIWVLLGVAAAGIGIGLLLRPTDRDPGRNTGGRAPPQPPPDRTPGTTATDPLLDVRASPTSPAAQKSLAAFAIAQAARGAAAVPDLVELLRRPDVDCGRSYEFVDGQLREYPSVRAACLEALRHIDGPEAANALRSWLELTEVTGEAYLAGLALSERGEKGFEPRLLDVAVAGDGPVTQEMVRLAARSDPTVTARRIADAAPRGAEDRDAGVLASGLSFVPWEQAAPVARGLLEEPAVSGKARLRYAEALLARPEPEALTVVREAMERGAFPAKTAGDLAEHAVASRAFTEDLRAGRAGDVAARARADAWAEEAWRLIDAAERAGAEGSEALRSRLGSRIQRGR